MTKMLFFAVGIAIGVYIGLRMVYTQEPEASVAEASERNSLYTELDGTQWSYTGDPTWTN